MQSTKTGDDSMTKRISRRGALKTGAAAGALAAFGLPAIQAQAQATELTFWTWRQEDRAQYGELFKPFLAKNPGVSIKYEAYEPQNYGTVLSTALAAGTGPDVIHIRAYGGTEQFAKAGYLQALSRDAVPELANFTDAALASTSMRADRQIYALPFASQTLGIFINTELFEKNGWKAADTWAELIALCQKIKGTGVIPIANGLATAFMAEIFTGVVSAGFLGTEFNPDILAGKATFEDARFTGALGKMLELRDHMPPGFTGIDYPTSQQLFLSGRAAMFFGGSFEIANFRKQNPNIKMAFHAPVAAAAGGARLVPLFFDGGYAVNAKSAKKDTALKLVRYLGTPEFGTPFSKLLGNISPIKGVEAEDTMLKGVAALNASSIPYVMLVNFRYQEPTGSTLLQQNVQKMMGGTATPAEVGKTVTDGIATYFEPFKKK
jgi:raffinose/stachyose/melibiose transport system substrate-binding protein